MEPSTVLVAKIPYHDDIQSFFFARNLPENIDTTVGTSGKEHLLELGVISTTSK
jgi:hypothetical protein